ncbi:MAG TPA: formate dehydrogenase subunit alpha [Aridibacter sp.]|nr:formate dehydrogenase subunit alpha [Aridibacter sp.]
MVKASFNGTEYEFEEGMTILKAARSAGIDIPTLCSDDRIEPAGACRLCLVKISNFAPGERPSCMLEVLEGLEIETHTPELEKAREMNLRMLARSYPREAFEEFPEKRFHAIAREYGLTGEDFASPDGMASADESHPYISVEMSRCIDCFSCVRICDQLEGKFVWQVVARGGATQIVPDSFGAFGDSTCVSCGACADVCPTGALEDRSRIAHGEAESWTRTVCPYCGTGCEMDVGTKSGRIVQIKPSAHAPVNLGHLCVKGRYAHEFVHSGERVTDPMIRENGEWKKVSWDEAVSFVASRMKEIREANGVNSVGVLGSARATNEENYVAQKFARVVLGSNTVDCCARVCHTPTAAAMKMMLGTGAATNSFADIEHTRTFLICGANPSENHPVLGSRIKQAVLRGGANLIVIDPRRTELAAIADIHLALTPGTNIALFNALAHAIIDEGLADEDFISERVEQYEEFRNFLKEYSPEAMAAVCGVEAGSIREAARMYATAKPSMSLHGLGMTEHTQGTESVMDVVNVALLTGNFGMRGAGVNPLRGQNNVQGSAHMGCDPGILTGSIGVAEGAELFSRVWDAPVPSETGLNLLQMIDAAGTGELKALWTIGYDIFLTLANAAETARCLEKLELLVIQDLFFNETAKEYAHVFLPAASSFEKDGTFMNGERRVQRVRKVIEPLGNSRTDWEIVCGVAAKMGFADKFAFESAEDIWNEVRAVWPDAFGITYPRLDVSGLQWNCPTEDHPGTEVLHKDSFAHGRTAKLRRIKYRPTKEIAEPDFPFILSTGRNLFQFNAGTMTMRSGVRAFRPTDTIDVSPGDAEKLGISDGETVRVRSRYGAAELPARISGTVKNGELFASFHDARVFLNRITSPHRDRYVMAPEYKVTAVRIEKIS